MDTKNTTRLRKSAGLIQSCGFRHGRPLVAKAGSWPVTAIEGGNRRTGLRHNGEASFRISDSFAKQACGGNRAVRSRPEELNRRQGSE
jgi:hypothetical protein